MEKDEIGALVGNVTDDIRRVAESPSYLGGGQSDPTFYIRGHFSFFFGRSRGSAPTLHCETHFGKTL